MLIDLLVGYLHLWTFRNNERKDHRFGTRPMALQENNPDSRQDQFPNGMTSSRSLLLELPIKRSGNINGGANRIGFHEIDSLTCAINMERLGCPNYATSTQVLERVEGWLISVIGGDDLAGGDSRTPLCAGGRPFLAPHDSKRTATFAATD